MNRAVIMAGAEIEDYSFYKAEEGDYVICADRGYRHALHLGIKPDILLGDFDSLGMELPSDIRTITFPAEKNETDLQIAIEHAIKIGYKKIYIIGAFGGRIDHFLGNISLLRYAHEKGATAVMADINTEIHLLYDSLTIPNTHTYLSVIPLFEDAVVSMDGVKYPLTRKCLVRGDTLGISNEITAKEAHVHVLAGSAFILLCQEKQNFQ